MPADDIAYLIVIHIPYAVDDEGTVLTGQMWVRDLRGMAAHLGRITVAAPCLPRSMLTPTMTGSFDFAQVASDDSELSFLPIPFYNSGKTFLRQARKTWSQIREYVRRSRVVHVDTGGWPIAQGQLAFMQSRRYRKPTLLFLGDGADPVSRFREKRARDRSLISKFGTWLLERQFDLYFRRAAAHADMVFFHNPVTESRFARFARRHARFFRTFVEDEMLMTGEALERKIADLREAPELRLLMAGRLIPMKGVDDAIRAVALARRLGAPISLTIVGSGSQEKVLRSLVTEARIEDAVAFRGEVPYGPAMFDLFRSHHGLVVCNLTDELSRNVLLGMAFGCVLISYENPATTGLTVHEENAWVCPRGRIDVLASAMVHLATDRNACERLLRNAVMTACDTTFSACHARRAELTRAAIAARF